MIDYVDDTPNLTGNTEYNDEHMEELIHTLRPRLFDVRLFEVFNRILHDPDSVPSSSSSHRKDIEQLGSLAKRVV